MSRYSERVEALENDEKRKKRLFTLIIVALVIIFLGGMIIGAISILNKEGTYDPAEAVPKTIVEKSGTKDELLSDFSTSLEKTRDFNKVKLSVYTDIEIPDDSITVSGEENDRISAFLKYIKPKALEELKKEYGSFDGKFGTDWSEKIIHSVLKGEDVLTAEEKLGRIENEAVVDCDTLFYDFVLDGGIDNADISKSTGADVFEKIKDAVLKELEAEAVAEDFSATCRNFEIHAEEAKSGTMKKVVYKRSYDIKLKLKFTGDFKALGTREISFLISAYENHVYTYAGIELSKHTLSMEKGKTEALEAFRTADEDVTVLWSSSNPEIAEVDDRGYIKGIALSEKPVTITAEFTYLGNTYKDSCEVIVRKPVEEIKTTPKELSLKVGETATLKAELSPKNATVREIWWFCEDESVAAVDENGVVTAKAPGETKVFAVAKDGYFRSSCDVTVSD